MVRSVDLGSVALWPLPQPSATRRDRGRLSAAPHIFIPGRLDVDDGGHDVADDAAAPRNLPSLNRAAPGSVPAFSSGHFGLPDGMDGVRYCRARSRLVVA